MVVLLWLCKNEIMGDVMFDVLCKGVGIWFVKLFIVFLIFSFVIWGVIDFL